MQKEELCLYAPCHLRLTAQLSDWMLDPSAAQWRDLCGFNVLCRHTGDAEWDLVLSPARPENTNHCPHKELPIPTGEEFLMAFYRAQPATVPSLSLDKKHRPEWSRLWLLSDLEKVASHPGTDHQARNKDPPLPYTRAFLFFSAF